MESVKQSGLLSGLSSGCNVFTLVAVYLLSHFIDVDIITT